jgi:type I restriction enzyme M protein
MAPAFFERMKKSLNNKRNEITDRQIDKLTRIYGKNRDGETAKVRINGDTETRIVSRIFENREFGFLKVTVERPLRMSFQATPERIARLDGHSAFINLATSKKRKDDQASAREIEEGREQQAAIKAVLATLEAKGQYMDREIFEADLDRVATRARVKVPAPVKKAIFAALGERDPDAEICRDSKGREEPDAELRDTENIPLPETFKMPGAFLKAIEKPGNAEHKGAKLPMFFGPDKPNEHLVTAMRPAIDAYMAREVLPHVPRCLGGLRQDQDRLRNSHQPAFLRLQAAAPAG